MTTLLTRRGTGAPPNTTLAEGELAVDPAAGALYVGDAATNTVPLVQSGQLLPGGTTLSSVLRWDGASWVEEPDFLVAEDGGFTANGASTIASLTVQGATTVQGLLKGSWTDFGTPNADSQIQKLTQAQYDGLGPPDANTLYLIVG